MFAGVETARVIILQRNRAVSVVLAMADGQKLTSEQAAEKPPSVSASAGEDAGSFDCGF